MSAMIKVPIQNSLAPFVGGKDFPHIQAVGNLTTALAARLLRLTHYIYIYIYIYALKPEAVSHSPPGLEIL
jgi:hypothetical protein